MKKVIKELNQTINKNINDTTGYRKIQVFINGTDYIPPQIEKALI